MLGVVDGFRPKGVEAETNIEDRKQFLRKIGYKILHISSSHTHCAIIYLEDASFRHI
ncbi:MAG TPA: adenosine-specific kinase [Nitrososphaeraceae archaeon]|nr:adenosine-specific kinase [Nitrososphaeraceae archaeon]